MFHLQTPHQAQHPSSPIPAWTQALLFFLSGVSTTNQTLWNHALSLSPIYFVSKQLLSLLVSLLDRFWQALRGQPWPKGSFMPLVDLYLSTVLKSKLLVCRVWDGPSPALSALVISCGNSSKLPLNWFCCSAISFPSNLCSRPWLEWIFYHVKSDHVINLVKIGQWLPAICRIKSEIFWPT